MKHKQYENFKAFLCLLYDFILNLNTGLVTDFRLAPCVIFILYLTFRWSYTALYNNNNNNDNDNNNNNNNNNNNYNIIPLILQSLILNHFIDSLEVFPEDSLDVLFFCVIGYNFETFTMPDSIELCNHLRLL